jgi:hypothetical protein
LKKDVAGFAKNFEGLFKVKYDHLPEEDDDEEEEDDDDEENQIEMTNKQKKRQTKTRQQQHRSSTSSQHILTDDDGQEEEEDHYDNTVANPMLAQQQQQPKKKAKATKPPSLSQSQEEAVQSEQPVEIEHDVDYTGVYRLDDLSQHSNIGPIGTGLNNKNFNNNNNNKSNKDKSSHRLSGNKMTYEDNLAARLTVNTQSTTSTQLSSMSLHPTPVSHPRIPMKSTREKVVEFYRKYNPSKLSSLDEILNRYQGKETDLLKKLHAQYNVPYEE